MDIQDDKFDLQIRDLLENGEEEVPAGIWDVVSRRLVAVNARIRRVRIVRRVSLYGGIAVAAALLVGVFLLVGNPTGVPEDSLLASAENIEQASVEDIEAVTFESENSTLSDTDNTTTTEEKTNDSLNNNSTNTNNLGIIPALPEADDSYGEVKTIEEQIAQAGDYLANVETVLTESPAEEIVGSEEMADSPIEKLDQNTEEIEIESAVSGEQSSSYQSWDDSFNFVEEQYGSQKVRTAITMSGNALTNAASSSSTHTSGRQMASSLIQNQTQTGITDYSEDSSYGIPVSFGLGVKIIFTPHWSLGVGVNYTLLTRKFAGIYTSYSPESDSFAQTPYSKIRNVQHYVGIPINAYYSIVKSRVVDFYAYAGGAVEKCVANKYTFDDIVYKENVSGVQLSVDAGIGVEFIIADMVGFYIDPSVRYYIPNSKQPTSIRTQEPLNLGFELGFRVRF